MGKQGVMYKVYGCSMLPIRKVLDNINRHLNVDSPKGWMMCTVGLGEDNLCDEDGNSIIEEIALQDKATCDMVSICKYSDVGEVDMMIRVPVGASDLCSKLAEAFITEMKILRPDARIEKKYVSGDIRKMSDLLTAMMLLDVKDVKSLLDVNDYSSDVYTCDDTTYRFEDIIALPVAWEWAIGARDSWTDKEEGNDFYDRNQEIKRMLHDRLNIDWDNVPEDILPDVVVRDGMIDESDDPMADFFEFDIDYMRAHYDEKDILLYYYVHRMELKKVKALIDAGANPHSIVDGGDDAEMYAVWHSEGGLMEMVHVVKGEYDESMTSATSRDDVYDNCWWTLMRAAAYEKMISYLA